MINMKLKWHHINICNNIIVFFGCPMYFLACLTMIAPIYDRCNSRNEIYQPIDYYLEEGFQHWSYD
jgi:hypothetical protein